MSSRSRAGLFLGLAAAAAVAGALIVSGYRDSALQAYGDLIPVLVATRQLPASEALDPASASRRTGVRRVPERFVQSDGLTYPAQAIGLEPVTRLPAGTYLTRSNLRAPRAKQSGADPRLEGDRRPVEIRVDGASALAGSHGGASRVDVVVTTEPSGPGPGRTFVAASGVPLLGLRTSRYEGAPGQGRAVLALERPEALALIQAEAFARSVRLLPRPAFVP